MPTQWHLSPPLTSAAIVFTHGHSSPLSLAARFHWCHTNCSRYINNGWAFSRQTSHTVLLAQGCQSHFHRGPHQPHGCLQRAEIIVGLYKCNYSLTVKDLKSHSALWRQPQGWRGPRWRWVWHPCQETDQEDSESTYKLNWPHKLEWPVLILKNSPRDLL